MHVDHMIFLILHVSTGRAAYLLTWKNLGKNVLTIGAMGRGENPSGHISFFSAMQRVYKL